MEKQSRLVEQHGYIKQPEQGIFAVRIRTIAGNLTSTQLRSLADLSEQYGNGQVHITTRQSVELHWVKKEQLNNAFQAVADLGLLLAVRGPRVLTVIACPGAGVCQKGIGHTVSLASQLDDELVGSKQPSKTKIALSGCPNSCAKPQINDIGLHGIIFPDAGEGCIGCKTCETVCKTGAISIETGAPQIIAENCVGCGLCVRNCPKQVLRIRQQGYSLYIGGKIGRNPMLGIKLFSVIPEQEAAVYIERVLGAYNRLAYEKERIGDVLRRIGLDRFRQEV